jgi:DNA (cytosine-5)-methyltransferase 1
MGTVIGALVERGYGISYRVLDAQYFGVPQRRRRVFIVGCLGDSGRASSEVLALVEGMRGNLETSNKKRKVTTRTTPQSFGQTGFAKYTEGVTTLTATSYKRPEDNIVVTSSSFGGYTEGVGTLRANGGDLGGGSENLVVHKE